MCCWSMAYKQVFASLGYLSLTISINAGFDLTFSEINQFDGIQSTGTLNGKPIFMNKMILRSCLTYLLVSVSQCKNGSKPVQRFTQTASLLKSFDLLLMSCGPLVRKKTIEATPSHLLCSNLHSYQVWWPPNMWFASPVVTKKHSVGTIFTQCRHITWLIRSLTEIFWRWSSLRIRQYQRRDFHGSWCASPGQDDRWNGSLMSL